MTSQRENDRTIIAGTLLVEESTLLPEPSPQGSYSVGDGWTRIPNTVAFEKKLVTAGWAFFYMAGTMRARVLGFERHRMIHTAVKRLLAKAARQKCNCLEIDHIVMASFWGMPMVTVLAHSRHIQQQTSLCSANV